MYEVNMVQIDGFNLGQVDDNVWGFVDYNELKELVFEMETEDEQEYVYEA